MATKSDGKNSRLFSREELAGYQRKIIRKSKVLIVGQGAGGQNLHLPFRLVAMGATFLTDFDSFERSNRTHSPFFPSRSERAQWGKQKAKAVAHKSSLIGTGGEVWYRIGYGQELPDAVFEHVDAVDNGVDNLPGRAFQSEKALLNNRPFIDGALGGEYVSIGVYKPAEPSETDRLPCWRCRYPQIAPEKADYGCKWYAQQVESLGMIPAIQPAAQVAAGLQAEHTIMALHGEFPLAYRRLVLNIRTGESHVIELKRNPACPSYWHKLSGHPLTLETTGNDTLAKLLQELDTVLGNDPMLQPLVPLVWSMPCTECKCMVSVRASAWLWEANPKCAECGGLFRRISEESLPDGTANSYKVINRTREELLGLSLGEIGLGPRSLFLAFTRDDPIPKLFRLGGDVTKAVEGLFTNVSYGGIPVQASKASRALVGGKEKAS